MQLPTGITNVLFLLSLSTQILASPTAKSVFKAVQFPGVHDSATAKPVTLPAIAKRETSTINLSNVKRSAEAFASDALDAPIRKRTPVAQPSSQISTSLEIREPEPVAVSVNIVPEVASEERDFEETLVARGDIEEVEMLEERTIKVAPGESSVGIDNGLPSLLAISFIIILMYGGIIIFSNDEDH